MRNLVSHRNKVPCLSEELGSQHSSIHRDRCTGHVRRVCRSDKGDHMSDLLRCRHSFDRYRRDERRLIFICAGEARKHTGVRSAWSNYVYPHSGARDFQCSGFCQALYCMFASHINGRSGSPDASIGRRDIDDAPAPLCQHHPQFVFHAEQCS